MHGPNLSQFITEHSTNKLNYYKGGLYQLYICNLKQSYEISMYDEADELDKITYYIDDDKHGLYLSTYEFSNRVYSIQYFNQGDLLKILPIRWDYYIKL